jgi:putative ABC transport system permease protein
MTIATFIAKNALRNKRRAALSILSVAISLFLLVTLLVALREMTVPPEDLGAALRVVVRNRVSLANLLPERQRPIIERVPGVEAASPFTWFGGKFRDEEMMTFAQFAMDAKLLRAIFGEAKLPDAQYEAFIKDQTACVVGKLTAEKYKLKIGDRVQFTSTIFGCPLEMKIAGIYAGTLDDRNVLFHQKYLDESCNVIKGQVGMWWVKVRSIEEMPQVIETINKAFANTSAEVRAETERAFQLSFVSMMGGVKVFIQSISTVVVFTLLLVSASTMSMAIRERFRELAVLKAIGFRRHELFALILAESFGLAGAGALTGVGGAWLFFTHPKIAGIVAGVLSVLMVVNLLRALFRKKWGSAVTFLILAWVLGAGGWFACTRGTISQMTDNIFITFEVTLRIIAIGSAVATVLGVLASIMPSLAVARMSVVQGLKTLD